MKKFICRNCGTVNEASDKALEGEEEWLACTLPEGFEWILPAGKITPIVGDPIYVSGMGENLSYDAYLEKYNIDPEVAYNLMRGKSKTMASRIIAKQFQMKAQASSKARSSSWLDEDDWTS
jgi:hypothetical protein